MKKKTAILLAIFGGLLSAQVVPRLLGDSWIYPTGPSTYYSSNKIYALTVTPAPDRNKGKCVAVLKRSDSEANQIAWQRTLVNPVEPLGAMITNKGDYVVTFDTWFGVGKDPIVIYNSKGKLVRRHSLKSLGLEKYVQWVRILTGDEDGSMLGDMAEAYIRCSTASAYWQENAIKFLVKDERYLIVRLHWGMLLGVELSTGRVLKDVELKALKTEIDENVRREITSLLASDKEYEQVKGALIAGQEKYAPAIPRLRELLKSNARKASLEALAALGEKVDGVIIEKDIPRKGGA